MQYRVYIILLYFHLISCFGILIFNSSSCGNHHKKNTHCGLVNSSSSNTDNRNVSSNSVVFLGDSFTDFGTWQNFFPGIETANQGVGGQASIHVLNRLDVILLQHPQKIFLLVGANDLLQGYSVNSVITNVETIILHTKEISPDTKLYIQSLFPVGSDVRNYFSSLPTNANDLVLEINDGYKNLTSIYSLTYINIHQNLLDNQGNLNEKYSCIDNLHISLEGYRVWLETIQSYVTEPVAVASQI